jgi:hypothetical protein
VFQPPSTAKRVENRSTSTTISMVVCVVFSLRTNPTVASPLQAIGYSIGTQLQSADFNPNGTEVFRHMRESVW